MFQSLTRLQVRAAVALLLFAFAVIGIVQWGLYRYVTQVEHAEREQQKAFLIEKAEAGLQWEKASLLQSATDYTQWDDAYVFAQHPNPEFIESSLGISTHEINNIAHFAYINYDFKLIYGTRLIESFESMAEGELPALLNASGVAGSDFQIPNAGLMVWRKQVYSFATSPIKHSDGSGDDVGFLFISRHLDAEGLNRIASILDLNLGLMPSEQNANLEATPASKSRPQPSANGVIHQITNKFGDAVVDMTLEPKHPRASSTGRALKMLALISSGIALTLVLLAAWLLDRLVIRPLQQLTSDVTSLVQGDSRAARLTARLKTREFQLLEASINSMLDQIDSNKNMREARDAAVLADKMKSALIANTGHELRTPLHGIIGMTELALQEDLPAKSKQYVESANQIAHKLSRIIDDILDLSRLDAGQMALSPKPTDIRKLIGDILASLEPKIFDKPIQLIANVDASVPDCVEIDDLRLTQVLTNLLGNALKFTGQGQVQLQATTVKVRDQKQLKLLVSDTGIGIAPNKLNAVFEPFVQADLSTTREFGGTGLGLAITKRLIAAMGGDIAVHSTLGAGSIFSVLLPMQQCEGKTDTLDPTQNTTVALNNKSANEHRILVVDDDPVNLTIAVTSLEQAGFQVVSATTGVEAMAQFKLQNFDLILMDKHMPIKDGLQTTREIRNLEVGRAQPTIVLALTASALKSDRDDCLASGMNEVLVKPMSPPILVKMVKYHLAKAKS